MKRPTLTRCCSNTTAYTRDSSLREIGFERSWNEATYRRNLPGGLRDDCGCFHVVETRESACGHLRNRARQSLGHTRHRVAATARHALGAVLSSPEYRGACVWSGPYLVRTEVAGRHHSTATGKRVAEFAVGIVAKDRTGGPTFQTLDAEVPRVGIGLDLRQRQRLIERRNGSAYFGGQLHLALKSTRVYYTRLVAAHDSTPYGHDGALGARRSTPQCLSVTALRLAVFRSNAPVKEGRQLKITSPVPGSRNSSNPVSIRGTKLSMYATSSAVASAGSSNCNRPQLSISRVMSSMFLCPRLCS